MIDGNLEVHIFGPWLQNWIIKSTSIGAYIELILRQVIFDYYNVVN